MYMSYNQTKIWYEFRDKNMAEYEFCFISLGTKQAHKIDVNQDIGYAKLKFLIGNSKIYYCGANEFCLKSNKPNVL